MRYLKQGQIIRQNKQNIIHNPKEKEQFDQIKNQLKLACAQINMLRQSNHNLFCKLQIKEKQLVNYLNLKDQVQFLREREQNVKVQMNNYEEINRKLRQQLQKSERQRMRMQMQLKKLLLIEQNKIHNKDQQRQNNIISDRFITKRNRNNNQLYSIQNSQKINSSMSSHSSNAKENHYSTPKSKVKINIDQFVVENFPNKRKVYF